MRFWIHLPAGAEVIDFTYPFERAGAEGAYTYQARNFLPDRDIIVRWRP
ncbi:MAG: hypothetical protein KJ970_20690 [Candidatus Eisenbacteria bacterium]|uniref:Uncharacterized protein n=1 Tax=Eiseniibacteriota bacterium TaxID=2212470 RepID=A0A948S1A0_UNCEI|nr:hypothetical protein [Candidatus Eisenbacteria bacterium]MBU1947207.1 hypothetical protein [Candidatus Eisenbacteria bacterium]MBU2693344.1 hypothetical protein [Candidatus Eisenbacteria bacterium]